MVKNFFFTFGDQDDHASSFNMFTLTCTAIHSASSYHRLGLAQTSAKDGLIMTWD